MDAVWLWGWRRFGHRYSWVAFVSLWSTVLSILAYAVWLIMRFEDSGRYGAALAVAAVGALVIAAVSILPGSRTVWGAVESWRPGDPAADRRAIESTYAYGRGLYPRGPIAWVVGTSISAAAIGATTEASTGRVIQYGFIGAGLGFALTVMAIHSWNETMLRPVRQAIAAESDVGDDLPRSSPSFATWSSLTLLGAIWIFTMTGAITGAAIGTIGNDLAVRELPVMGVLIGTALLVLFGIPMTLAMSFGPSLRPLRDLAEGTQRVALGDYTGRLPVAQDDDLGVLAASFNRMQAGLAERERLQAAFGSYVDPALAERLLAQGSDLFSGERLEVTVMFVDIRDFTPFAEANTAEVTVAHLNELFEIVVATVNEHGGHVNKFLGDGAMVVFGAPGLVEDHAGHAVTAAVDIQRRVHDRFGGATRVGIGINTGTVIAGTIGGAGKLEFTLIGDAVNVAARVEQLTKLTADAILVTAATVASLAMRPSSLLDRGTHVLKGKSEPVAVHAIDPFGASPV